MICVYIPLGHKKQICSCPFYRWETGKTGKVISDFLKAPFHPMLSSGPEWIGSNELLQQIFVKMIWNEKYKYYFLSCVINQSECCRWTGSTALHHFLGDSDRLFSPSSPVAFKVVLSLVCPAKEMNREKLRLVFSLEELKWMLQFCSYFISKSLITWPSQLRKWAMQSSLGWSDQIWSDLTEE